MPSSCVNPSCEAEVLNGWAFCPLCGTDSRPEDCRMVVGDHEHGYLQSSGYCIKCGKAYEEPDPANLEGYKIGLNDHLGGSFVKGLFWWL